MSVNALSKPRYELPKMGRFVIRRSLGGGVRGKVFLAVDPADGRQVAIHWLNAPPSDRPGPGSTGVAEQVRRYATLRHPNIVPLHESGAYREFPFLVFDFVQGVTLRDQRLQTGPLPPQAALQVFSAILDGMACAHARGMLHLLLTPANIMIDAAGVPHLMDFGLAGITGADKPRRGVRPGPSRRYGAPEQCGERGEGSITARTDVYMLGQILFEMLGGRLPGYAESASAAFGLPASAARGLDDMDRMGLDAGLQSVIRCALSADANSRYADAAALKRAVDALMAPTEQQVDHDTVRALLERMEQKPSFPALSNNLIEINRLADENSDAGVDKLANIVLRDYAITNKLLQLANSSFYGAARQGVKTVSRAIQLMGMNVIRTTCNGLIYFNALKGDNEHLKDALISSFTGAMIGRHFAIQLKRKDLAEESFISGMFYRLGRSLTIFYFPGEFHEIVRLAGDDIHDEEAAAVKVLGIGFGDLGAAVAERWKFPDTIRESIRCLGPGTPPKPAKFAELQQQIAAFSNELCELAASAPVDGGLDRLDAFAVRFRGIIFISPAELVGLLDAALKRLREFSPVLGLELRGSRFVGRVGEFLAAMQIRMARLPAQADAESVN